MIPEQSVDRCFLAHGGRKFAAKSIDVALAFQFQRALLFKSSADLRDAIRERIHSVCDGLELHRHLSTPTSERFGFDGSCFRLRPNPLSLCSE